MTTETMDWAAAMTAARQSAEKAATLTERTVGGVAEVLQRQSRHSSELSEATKRLAAMEARLSSLSDELSAARSSHARPQPPCPRLWACLTLSVAVAALVASAVSSLS